MAIDITLGEGKMLNIIAKFDHILKITMKLMCEVEGSMMLLYYRDKTFHYSSKKVNS